MINKLKFTYDNVKKAFLELDKRNCGKLSAIDLAEFIKHGVKVDEGDSGRKGLDFTMMEYLIKLKNK